MNAHSPAKTGVNALMVTFDTYRDPDARKLMIASFMALHVIDEKTALARLRSLDGHGLAYAYREALARAGRGNQVDYDPCGVSR